jgi:hypothetical protein
MDELFKYLIWVVLIIGLLNSIFKKKKKPVSGLPGSPNSPKDSSMGQESEPVYKRTRSEEIDTGTVYTPSPYRDQYNTRSYEQPVSSDVDEYAIQREIEKMFRNDFQPRVPERLSERVRETATVTAPPAAADSYFKTEEAKPVVRELVTDIVEERAREFEIQMNKKDDTFNRYSDIIRNKFRDAGDLKEYIIISEILGKPKAFE